MQFKLKSLQNAIQTAEHWFTRFRAGQEVMRHKFLLTQNSLGLKNKLVGKYGKRIYEKQ